MLKAVVDTNVFISGIGWGGVPLEVLKLWRQDRFCLCVSLPIIDEIEQVIRELNLPISLWQDWKRLIFDRAILVEGGGNLPFSLRDVKDIKFLECAVLGGATYIISGDKDLLELEEYEDIKIVNPRSFIKLCRS